MCEEDSKGRVPGETSYHFAILHDVPAEKLPTSAGARSSLVVILCTRKSAAVSSLEPPVTTATYLSLALHQTFSSSSASQSESNISPQRVLKLAGISLSSEGTSKKPARAQGLLAATALHGPLKLRVLVRLQLKLFHPVSPFPLSSLQKHWGCIDKCACDLPAAGSFGHLRLRGNHQCCSTMHAFKAIDMQVRGDHVFALLQLSVDLSLQSQRQTILAYSKAAVMEKPSQGGPCLCTDFIHYSHAFRCARCIRRW